MDSGHYSGGDTARPKVQSSPALWAGQLFSTVNEYNRWADHLYKYLQISADKPTNFIYWLLAILKKKKNPTCISLTVILHLSLCILFDPFKAKYFFVFWCFAESSHRLKYYINPLVVRLQYFLGLCKFYSSDHQIMQSSILKYFKLGQDKKLLWFSVRIWARDSVMDGGWNFSQFPPRSCLFSLFTPKYQ